MAKVRKFYVTGGSIIPPADWNQTDETQRDYIKNKPDMSNLASISYVDEKFKDVGGVRAHCHYEGTIGIDGNNIDDIFQLMTPDDGYISGDTFIIKTLITNDTYSYTAYVYDGLEWRAMDGNYSADNIYFDTDITITTPAGNIGISNGSGTIPSAGKNLKQVFETIWTKEENPYVAMPAVTINTDVQYKEIGTSIAPSYEVSLSAGSYSYGPETNITAQTWIIVFEDEIKTTSAGNFSSIIVTEGECCNITATATYNDGAIPKTNLGNDCADKQIKASSASASKNLLVGYKPNFYGFTTDPIDIDTISSSIVRGLTINQKQNLTPVSSVTSDTAWMQFFYAIPKGRKASLSVKDSNNLPLTVKSKDVAVNHVGEVSSTYTLFYINNDAAYGATTLTLMWK